MFGFEKLVVHQKAKEFNLRIKKEILSNVKLDWTAKDQLRRAAMSVMLNIAEGSSRMTNADERYFYVIARGSIFECVSLLELLYAEQVISIEQKKNFYASAEEISRMLFKLIQNLQGKNTSRIL